jgi:hypothetical protein
MYQKLLRYWKESDKRRRLKYIAEKKEYVEIKTLKNIPENKKMQLFTLLPVKTFALSNILIDKTAVQDLILGDKGSNIGEAHAGLCNIVRTLLKEDPMTTVKPFFGMK